MRRSPGLAALILAVGAIVFPAVATAHPLGNFTVNRAIVIEVGHRIDLRYVIDMAEIPAFEAIQDLDADGDGAMSASEADAYAAMACAEVMGDLVVTIDGVDGPLASAAEPTISFPEGVGGLETLRLECSFGAQVADPDGSHVLVVRDETVSERIGWHEVTARAMGAATIVDSDVPTESRSAELTAYPDDALSTPPDIRSAELTFTLDPSASASALPDDRAPTERLPADDPLAALVGGELSVPVVLLALAVALGLGAIHALSPGHGKTLVAAYVLGAGGDARSAMQIGLSVAISHTAGVFALGVLILVAGELFLPERVIGWLSLVSGVIVAVLGVVLIVRQLSRIRTARRSDPHGHDHGHDDDHDHDDHDHGHDHGHSHEPPVGGLTWRSAVALGFAGGAVPSASAVIVLLVAISTDRLVFGSVLIAMFGIGMAIVLGGLGLIIARVNLAATRSRRGLLASPRIRSLGRWVPVVAGVVVLVTGIAFASVAASQLS